MKIKTKLKSVMREGASPPSLTSASVGGGLMIEKQRDEERPKKRKRNNDSLVESTSSSSSSNDATPTQNDNTLSSSICGDSFASIRPPLSPSVLTFLSTPPYNFPNPTPVQSTTIPLFLTHRDVLVRAVTGSGKTLAFVIPVIEMILRRTTLLRKNQIGGLILEPTRELARQTYGVCTDLCQAVGMTLPLLLVGGGGGGGENNGGGGGAAMSAVARDLRRFAELHSDVVIGTPGRVEDVLTRYDDVDVSELEVLILDESDVLLDMGFEVTLTSILSRLPRMRRTGLFSATNTSGVRRLCVRSGMRNPVVVDVAIGTIARSSKGQDQNAEIDVDAEEDNMDDNNVAGDPRQQQQQQDQATPSSLTNYYLLCPLDEKLSRLVTFLTQHPNDKVIVFFLTCACVEYYGAVLRHLKPPCKGYEYVALHGKLAQRRRETAMEIFRGTGGVDASASPGSALLCTDVASRGLDVPDVSWTVQFDSPVDPSSYVHRVGRSARAGRVGKSLVFLTRKEEAYVDFLRLRKVPVRELPDKELCKPPSTGEGEMQDNVNEMPRKNDKDTMDTEKGDIEPNRVITSAAGPDIFLWDVLPSIRKFVLKDRDILEKGTKAYTSYIRAYKEHHCGFIFRFASLDLGLLASSFSLLRLPKMPELRDKKLVNFVPAGPEVNIHAIPFMDKARESSRQKRLAVELAAGGKNAKQIKAEQRAAERIAKSKERRATEVAKGRNPHKKKGKQARIFDEWDELAKEERLYKKLRSKKITKEEYDKLMYGGDEGSEAENGDSD